MKLIVCVLSLITLANQISTVLSQHPVILKIDPKKTKSIEEMDDRELEAKRNMKYDPWWLRGHPDREIMIKNFKAWNSCRYSRRPDNECDALFEILVSPAQLIIAKMHSYELYIAETFNNHATCLKSKRSEEDCNSEKLKRDKIANELENEMYPWPEIYEVCITAKPKSFCEQHIKLLHLPENRVMKPDGQIQMMKLIVCITSGGSTDECVEENKVSVVDMKDSVHVIETHSRGGNEL